MQIKNAKLRNALALLISGMSFFNRIIPKKKNCILFYSNTGFKDNNKVLFDYMLAHGYEQHYRIYCCINTAAAYSSTKNVKYIGNLWGVFYFLICRYVFYYNGKIPIKPAKTQTVVNLYHGIPLKKIGRMVSPHQDLNFSSLYLAPTPKVGAILQQCFGCAAEQILLCSAPRNDLLFHLKEQYRTWFGTYTKVFFWLPTFRNSAVSDTHDSDLSSYSSSGLSVLHHYEDLQTINTALLAKKSLLFIKLHPMELDLAAEQYQFSNIKIEKDKTLQQNKVELYDLLGFADALITDYSSVYFDFLCLNRPIGFTVDDLLSYTQNRGFTIDNPLEAMPGEKIRTAKEFLAFLECVWNGKDMFSLQRQKVAADFCGVNNGCNCSKLLDMLDLKKR